MMIIQLLNIQTYGTRIFKDGLWTSYNKDNEIIWIGDDIYEHGNYIDYYDYENDLIRRKKENGITTSYSYSQRIEEVKNNNKEGLIISINDIYGNVYDLSNGDYISFYPTGILRYIVQGDIVKDFYRNSTQEYYYTRDKTNNIYTFYHNDEILYTTDNPDSFKIKYIDGEQRVILEDGTIIDPDIEEIIETTEMTTEEEIPSNSLEDYENR